MRNERLASAAGRLDDVPYFATIYLESQFRSPLLAR